MTVFALSWGTTVLHYRRGSFLLVQLFGTSSSPKIPIYVLLAERRRASSCSGSWRSTRVSKLKKRSAHVRMEMDPLNRWSETHRSDTGHAPF